MYKGREEDMILPEGFDPELGDQNFTDDGELIDTAITNPTTDNGAVVNNEEGSDTQVPPDTTTVVDGATDGATESQIEAPRQTLKIRYNHQDKELSMDEAAILAQKGMNYDRIEQRSREQGSKLNRYEELAKRFGFESAEAMMSQAEQNFVEVRVQDLVNQGNSEAVARFLVGQEMKEQKQAAATEQQPQEVSDIDTPPEPTTGLTPEIKQEIQEFSAAYPGVTKIPEEVFKMHQDGVKLKTAYAIWERNNAYEQAQAERQAAINELAILKQNQAAAARGPVTGTTGKTAPTKEEADDPFLRGFNLDY